MADHASPIAKFLAYGSAVASIFAVVSTAIISWNANSLQRGNNTINVIASYGDETIREARKALRQDLPQDRMARAMSFQNVSPLRGALGLVATCYSEALCLPAPILDYFCPDVLLFDQKFGAGAPDIRDEIPFSADAALAELTADCANQ